MQRIQIHLYQRQKNFVNFLSFIQMHIKFWKISKKDDPHNLCISEFTHTERSA